MVTLAKPAVWNVDPAFVDPGFSNLWRGLTFMSPFWDHSGTAFIENTWDTPGRASNPVLAAGPSGIALDFDEDNDFIEWGESRAQAAWAAASGDEWTVFVFLHTNTVSGSAFQYFVSIGQVASEGSLNLLFDETTTGNNWQAFLEGTNLVGEHSAGAPAADTDYKFVFRKGPALIEIILDGEQIASSSTVTGNVDAKNVEIGRRDDNNADRYFGGKLYLVCRWNRALSDVELDTMYRDPYGLIRPASSLFVEAAAAPAAPVVRRRQLTTVRM